MTLNKLCEKYKLKWSRFSIFYHNFSNLRNTFQGDLNHKLLKRVGFKDFEDLEHNYNTASKIDNKCIYNYKCQSSILMYKAIYKDFMQLLLYWLYTTTPQKRMNQKFSKVRALGNKNKNLTFRKKLPPKDKQTPPKMYETR